MAGQGITVSILAKIEGWLDLIKLIQNAMKNIKPGTDISKGLVKDLQLVNDMVNNLGKNMNQRLTSDSLITGFVDKIMQVEEVFNRLGTSMSHISFGDIKPEYITAGFKDLLLTLELANNALGQGMESSFQNAIANSKTLLKEFERMKIDPKSMNINAIQEALAERGKALEKDVNEGLKKLTDFEKGLEKLKNTRDELAARDAFLGKDANATVQSLLVGHQLPTKGTILDADELEKQVSFFRSNLLKAGFTPTQLNRIIPDLETVMKAGHWDEMPSKFAEYLREAQNRTRNSLEKASQEYRDAIVLHQRMSGTLSHLSSLRFNNTLAQNEVSNILSGTVLNDTRSLRDIVSNLRLQLEQAVTSGFKGLGSKLFSSSLQGMQDASAAMKDYSAALDQVKAKEQAVNKVLGVVLRYFSIYAAVRMVSKGIRSMMTNIKDLDKTITEIAIVTKMNQNDLWGLMPLYTKLAKQYAASISGVYKVSQLYYQQGLGQLDVMALTELTLKMARISGLDYAEATDYMTNAVRSFKMEMTEALTVVDVYSAVAASSASSVTELATAMSKTASSAAAVGSSFENTTAMLAVMIEATRESPENIGSAMKSIISRYGELKENKTGIDEEGEEYSLNKVDKALLTVGISIHDANGEFRDFDDVIFELSEKWNGIDKNTLRYIATVMAGNRQQSRFLALVSSAERLKEESEKAANSEDASQLQFLKTMDSIEAKTQLFLTSLLSLYTSSGLEKLYKGLLDFGNEFANTLENISGKHGLVGAISNVGASFITMATLATTAFSSIKRHLMTTKMLMSNKAADLVAENEIAANNARIAQLRTVPTHTMLGDSTNGYIRVPNEKYADAQDEIKRLEARNEQLGAGKEDRNTNLLNTKLSNKNINTKIGLGMAASAAGMVLSSLANTIDINENRGLKGWLTAGGSGLSGLGTGLMVGATAGGPIGALVGALSALPGVILGLGMLSESTTERVEKLEKNITDAKNEKIKSKDDLRTLEDYKKKYDELSKSLYESTEKKKEFIELSNSIADSYPELIKSMDAEGNYILNMTEGYENLAKAKREAYKLDIIESAAAEVAGLKDTDYVLKNIYGQTPILNKKTLGLTTTNIEELAAIDYTQTNWLEQANKKLVLTLTVDQLFNGKYTDVVGGTTVSSNIVKDIYTRFIEQMNAGVDAGLAKTNIKEQFAQSYGDKYSDFIDAFSVDFYNQLRLRLDLPDFQESLARNEISTSGTELINLYSATLESVDKTESSDIQERLIHEELMKEWDKYYKENEEALNNGTLSWDDAVKTFYSSHEQMWYKMERESEVINTLSDEMNEFYQNFGLHTKADIRKLFPEGELSDLLQLLLKWLEDIFDLDFKDMFENYSNWLKQKDVANFNVKDYSDKVGAEYLTQIQSLYKNILSNTNLSEKLIASLVAALNGITDFITNENLDFDTRSALLDKYSAADLTSLIGIYDFINEIINLDIDIDTTDLITKIHKLGDVLTVNFESEINSYYDAIESSVEDFNKAVKSATEGMDLKTARELAEKMGKGLDEFLVVGGKFYFNDIEVLKEAYIKENEEWVKDVLKNVEDRYSVLKNLLQVTVKNKEGSAIGVIPISSTNILSGKYSMDTLSELFKSDQAKAGFLEETGISFEEFTKYYEEYQAEAETFTGNFIEFMLLRVQKTLSESKDALSDYMILNVGISLLKSGDIKGFLKTTGVVKTEELLKKDAKDLINVDLKFEARQKALTEKSAWLAEVRKKDASEQAALLANPPEETTMNYWVEKLEAEESEKLIKENADIEEEMVLAIASGNIEDLPEKLLQFSKTIFEARRSVLSNLTTSINDILGGQTNKLFIDLTNMVLAQELYDLGFLEKKLDDEGNVIEDYQLKLGDVVSLTLDVINGTKSLNSWILEHYTSGADKLKALQEYNNLIYKNIIETTTNLMDKTSTVTFDEFTNYLNDIKGFDFSKDNVYLKDNKTFTTEFLVLLDKYGLEFNKATGRFFIKRQELYLRGLKLDIDELGEDATLEERNAAEAKYDAGVLRITTLRTEALNTLFKDYDNISQTDLESIANAFEEGYSDLRDRITEDNGLGGRKLSIKKVQSWLKTEQLTEDLIALYEGLIAGIADDYLDNISNAMTNVTKGVTKLADMLKFVDDYILVTGQKVDAMQLFEFDSILQAFTLKPEYLLRYISALRKLLLEAGYAEDMVESYIQSLTIGVAAAAVDIKSYITSDRTTGQIAETTERQIANFLTTIAKQSELAYEYRILALEDLDNEMLKMPEDIRAKITDNDKANWLKKRAHELAALGKKFNESLIEQYGDIITEILTLDPSDILKQFAEGGEKAVQYGEVLAKAQGKELTPEEMQQYYAPMIEKYSNMANQVAELTIGLYIGEGDLRTLLHDAGVVDDAGNVIASVTEMVSAYEEIYKRMADDSKATKTQLNSVYAKMLTAQEQGDIDAISVMGDAMGMTYDALGEILGKYGVELKSWLADNTDIYEKIGGGKIRITNFTAFARRRGWEPGSEEYTSAFKSYNDGLIEANKKVKDQIDSELLGFAELKPGDWFNLTYITETLKKFAKDNKKDFSKEIINTKSALQDAKKTGLSAAVMGPLELEILKLESQDLFTQLNRTLSGFGAYLDDGILKLSDNANLIGVALTLSNVAMEAGIGISGLLQDMITSIMSSYTEAINKGIEGGMTASEATQLKKKAADLGLSDISFMENAEGLQLSLESSIALYYAMGKINGLLKKLTFNKLKDSLEKTNRHFKDSNSLLAHMLELLSLVKDLSEGRFDIDSETSDARIALYQLELALALEILSVRMNTAEADWNFMNNDDLPANAENAMEYWTGWRDVTDSLDAWASSGRIDVHKFKAMATYIALIGDAAGESLEFMGKAVGGPNGMKADEIINMILDNQTIDKDGWFLTPEALLGYGFDMSLGSSGISQLVKDRVDKITTELLETQKSINNFFGDLYTISEEAKKNQTSFNEFVEKRGAEEYFNYDKFLNLSDETKTAWQDFISHVKINNKTFDELIGEGTKEFIKGSEGWNMMASLFNMFVLGWDASEGIPGIIEHLIASGFEGTYEFYNLPITIRGNNAVTILKNAAGQDVAYDDEGNEYTGESTEEAVAKAFKYMNTRDLKDLAIEFGGEKVPNTDLYDITIDGQTYRIGINGDHIEYVQIGPDGEPIQNSTLMANSVLQIIDKGYEEYKLLIESAGQYKAISGLGWWYKNLVESGALSLPTGAEPLSPEARSALLEAGLTTAARIQEEMNNMIEEYGKDAAPYEFAAKYHIKPELDETTGAVINKDEIAKSATLTLAAADVASGIDAAFLNENVKSSFSLAIADGLKTSLKSEGTIDVDAPEIILKPGKITIDAKKSEIGFKQEAEIEEVSATSTNEATLVSEEHKTGGITRTNKLIEEAAAERGIEPPSTEGEEATFTAIFETKPGTGAALGAVLLSEIPPVLLESEVELPDKEVTVTATADDQASEVIHDIEGKDVTITVGVSGVDAVLKAINSIEGKSVEVTVTETTIKKVIDEGAEGVPAAMGNVGLTSGNARAAGTLMGELGPELVVQNGRYFVAGQNGAEFVDLANDAIVFNHLQTLRLFKNGMSPDRGRAVNNERVAAAFAHGNWNGGEARGGIHAPGSNSGGSSNTTNNIINLVNNAAVGAAYIDTLPGTNNGGVWKSGANSAYQAAEDTKDAMAGAAEQVKNVVKQFDRWYNLLQDIAHLEKEITLEEAKRTRYASDMIPHGEEYFTSLMASLEALKEQLTILRKLNSEREEYYKTLRKELESGAMGIAYTIGDDLLPHYKEGYEFLENLLKADWWKTGAPNYDATAIYNKLNSMGFGSMLEYDSSNNKIDKSKEGYLTTAVQGLLERLDKGLQEALKYHDERMEGLLNELELIDAENQILKAIEDNLISVENKVLKAIEDMRQQEIDNLKDEKETIEKSANTLIDGLNDQLDRERSLYQNQLNVDELNTLQRRLGILLRSGGSASEIADLQAQIQEKQYDNYFDALELQIQAILDASDAEIQRLDNLITLMEETLAYLKEHGLLWADVNNVLKGTAQDIVDFISGNTTEYWSKSSTELAQVLRTDLFEAQLFKKYLGKVEGGMEALIAMYGENATESEHKTTSTTTDTTTTTTNTTNDLASKYSKAGTRRNYKSSTTYSGAGYTGTPAYTGAADGGDLIYYLTEDGRVGIVRGANLKQALYHLNQMEGMIGSKIVGVGSNYGDLPAVQAALANGVDLLTTGLYTTESGGGTGSQEKELTDAAKAMTEAYMQSDEGKANSYSWSHWEGKGDKDVNPIETWIITDPNTGEEITKTVDNSIGALTTALLEEIHNTHNINNNSGGTSGSSNTGKTFSNGKHPGDPVPGKLGMVYDNLGKWVYEKDYKGKASGGYVGHGIYELGELGTETVLTASQTLILRNNILSNRPDSLISLLKSYNEAYHGLSQNAYDSISNTASEIITIERAEVNLLIEKLADDYDSRRAANTIMDEMLRIASKTKANNSVRR